MARMPAIRPGHGFAPIALAALLVVACTSTGQTGSGSPAPGASSSPAAAASASAPGSPDATVVPETASPSVAVGPPAATLAVDGGDPVAGQLGSYTWSGNGSDSPWLPGAPITVGAGELLTARLDPDAEVASWSARRVAAGTSDGAGAVELGEGAAPIAFAAPATGHWSVQLTVGFAGELGSASYYWDVTVR
jgi:hypothetical protein